MRGIAAFALDVRLLWRHGFFWVYVVACGVYWLLLHFVPASYQETTALLLTFSDPSALGLILAGGMVMLESDQGVHDPLFVTPLRVREYLAAKAAALATLSLAAAWAIHLPSLGMPASPLAYSIGVVLTSSLMTLLSIGVVAKCRTINGFIMKSQAFALPFTIPLLGMLDGWHYPIYYLLPTEGTILLLESAYRKLATWEWIYAILILVVWNAVIFFWARLSYEKHRLGRVGSNDQ